MNDLSPEITGTRKKKIDDYNRKAQGVTEIKQKC